MLVKCECQSEQPAPQKLHVIGQCAARALQHVLLLLVLLSKSCDHRFWPHLIADPNAGFPGGV